MGPGLHVAGIGYMGKGWLKASGRHLDLDNRFLDQRAHFANQRIVALAFFEEDRRRAMKPRLFLRGDVFGGEHHDGNAAPLVVACNSSMKANPSISGIIKFSRIKLGGDCSTRSIASRPFVASRTLSPSWDKARRTTSRTASSSSTTRTGRVDALSRKFLENLDEVPAVHGFRHVLRGPESVACAFLSSIFVSIMMTAI